MRRIHPHVRRLRQTMTDAERLLWPHLRARRLGGWKFRRQWTLGPYVADFCCIEAKLVVELDGGQHNADKDAARTAQLEAMGYQVIRFWNHEVVENIDGLLAALSARLGPHPDPLPHTGEGA